MDGDTDGVGEGAFVDGVIADMEAVGWEFPRKRTSSCLVRAVYSAIFPLIVSTMPELLSSRRYKFI